MIRVQHRGSAAAVAGAKRRRMPWVVLIALFTLGLAGFGLTSSSTGEQSVPAAAALHSPIAVAVPAAAGGVNTALLHGHSADSPLALAGTTLAFALLALALARRAGARPALLGADARRLLPGRAPPRLPAAR